MKLANPYYTEIIMILYVSKTNPSNAAYFNTLSALEAMDNYGNLHTTNAMIAYNHALSMLKTCKLAYPKSHQSAVKTYLLRI